MFRISKRRIATLAEGLDQLADSELAALSIPFFSPDEIAALIRYTQKLQWRTARQLVGDGVHQDFQICLPAPRRGALGQLADLLEEHLAEISSLQPGLFDGRFICNDLAVQHYLPGSKGIGIHRDGARYRNLVFIVTLAGQSRFFIAADREGQQITELDDSPGRLLLLAAPGFSGLADPKKRPLHGVDQVTSGRLSLGLRQEVPACPSARLRTPRGSTQPIVPSARR